MVHQVGVDSLELLPQLWRTSCGVRFGLWRFTRHATLDDFPADARCLRCFPATAGVPAIPERVSSDDDSGASASA